jgi:flagellar hook-associated protein 2
VLPGVTLTLKKVSAPGTSVTVGSAKDPTAIADKIDKMVTSFNIIANTIADATKYDATAKKAGLLIDSSSVRQIRQLMSTSVSGSSATDSAVMAGVTLNRDGTMDFDRAKFLEQFAKDPVSTQALFVEGTTSGLGKRVLDVADKALNLDTGLLTSSQKSITDTVSQLQLSIDSMQTRLDRHAQFLRNQFNTMETALGSLRNQSSWLSSQLAGR